jgi:hypothetical protein
MVLDPFSALGLASNIVQFIDFGCKLLSTGRELHNSTDGVLESNIELEVITKDLIDLDEKLMRSSGLLTLRSESERALQTLAASCKKDAERLLSILDNFKVSGPSPKWKSLRKGIRILWKKEEIEELLARLDRARSQLNTHLLAILRQV